MSSLISTLVSFCFSSAVFLAWRSCFLFFYAASLACFPATLLLNRGFAAIASSLDKVYVSAVMIGSTFIFFSLPLLFFVCFNAVLLFLDFREFGKCGALKIGKQIIIWFWRLGKRRS